MHAPPSQVLAKGVPEDALPGIAGRQVPLADEVTMIPGLLNSQGTKVRLHRAWGRMGHGGA